MKERDKEFESVLFNYHEKYKEKSLENRFFKHHDIISLLSRFKDFDIEEIGRSVQNRSINLVTVGKGSTKVLLWSQMHGNEPTATMALFDILNFFHTNDDLTTFKNGLLEHLTIYMIPMLNPDGAETYSRRNALGIDLNRDAIRLSSPEAKVFKAVLDKIKPHFAFNLHDQDPRYTVGNSHNVAAISFLAPPFDYDLSENETRVKAMQVIGGMNMKLQKFIPGLVGKFSDEYAPRAFGDNVQKWGASTILVESGCYKNDPEKQFLRKLNFVLLLSAFQSIAFEEYKGIAKDSYYEIPANTRNFYDFIIRNVSIESEGNFYTTDLGINRYEQSLNGGVYIEGKIDEIGDLSFARGGEEFDAQGMAIESGKTLPGSLSLGEITAEVALNYLKEGVTYIRMKDEIVEERPAQLPINITNRIISGISIDSPANLVLMDGNKVNYVVINGSIIDLSQPSESIKNSGLFII
jgi:hypothetical protein